MKIPTIWFVVMAVAFCFLGMSIQKAIGPMSPTETTPEVEPCWFHAIDLNDHGHQILPGNNIIVAHDTDSTKTFFISMADGCYRLVPCEPHTVVDSLFLYSWPGGSDGQ